MKLRESADWGTRGKAGGGSAVIALMLCALSAMLVHSGSAAAQELQTVVVTAQKRAQNLQDVGVSVSALRGADMESVGVNSSQDIAHAVTGVQLNSASGGDYGAQLTIRGIATSDFSPHQEAPNSLYIDDVYISAPDAQTGILFDLDRIEVLRGPQGTLFGRNSTGGLVNMITRKPTTGFEAYAEVTGGSFNEAKFEGAIGGPITSWLQERLAVAYQSSRGYDENRLPGFPDLNSINFRGIRNQLQLEFSDSVKGLLSLYFTHDDNREGFYGHVNTYYDPSIGGRPNFLPPDLNAWGTGPGLDLQGYRSPFGVSTIGEVGYIGFLYRDFTLPTFRLDWQLPSGPTITSITGYQHLHFNYDESCSGAPQLTCHDPYKQRLDQWSQELRIANTTDKLTWVGGLYGLYIDQHNFGAFNEPYYSGTPFAFDSFNLIHQKTKTAAVFGQAEYRFASHWRGTLGLRVGHDWKDFSTQTYYNEAGDLVSQDFVYRPPLLVSDFSPATVGDLAHESETYWSGKAQMDYIWSRNLLLYASVNRGIKGAGFNGNLTGATANANIPFKSEHVLEYEIGEKLTALDNRLRVNGAAFYYDYGDYQAYQLLTGVAPFTTNNNARFLGAELDMQATPISGLQLQLGVTGLGSRVFGVHTVQIGVVDQQSADTPKWSANGIIRYSRPLGPGTASVMWSTDYVSSKYHSVDNTPAVLVRSSIGHNASLSYSLNHWQITAAVTNLTDSVRQTAAYDNTAVGGYAIQTYMPPRWWTVSLRYQY